MDKLTKHTTAEFTSKLEQCPQEVRDYIQHLRSQEEALEAFLADDDFSYQLDLVDNLAQAIMVYAESLEGLKDQTQRIDILRGHFGRLVTLLKA